MWSVCISGGVLVSLELGLGLSSNFDLVLWSCVRVLLYGSQGV